MNRNPELFTTNSVKARSGESYLPNFNIYSGFNERTPRTIGYYDRDLNPPLSLADNHAVHRNPR